MVRIAVTGLGTVSSIGVGAAAFGDARAAGPSGISEITSFDVTGFPHRMAGEVRDFAPAAHLRRLDPARWARSSLFAAGAARLAVADGRLRLDDVAPGRAHAVMGTTSG